MFNKVTLACTLALVAAHVPALAQNWTPLRPAPDSLRPASADAIVFHTPTDAIPTRWFAVGLADLSRGKTPANLSHDDSVRIRTGAFGLGANAVIIRPGPKGYEAAAVWVGTESPAAARAVAALPAFTVSIPAAQIPADPAALPWPPDAMGICRDGVFLYNTTAVSACDMHRGFLYWRDPARVARLIEESVAQTRAEYRRHGWTDEQIAAIENGRVTVGMTAAMVRAALGEPDHINRMESRYGVREQWVYGQGRYVYIDGDRVTSVQTTR